jgi:transposase
MDIQIVCTDLVKTIFHLVAMNDKGAVVARKKFSRKQLLHYTSNKKAHLIGMEACGGAHFLGRALRETGTWSASYPSSIREAVCEDK